MNTRQLKSSLLLLLTAVIWGTAFVAQSVGMDYIQPFTFTSIRFFISGLVLLPANFWLRVYDGIAFGWWSEVGPIFSLGEVNLVPSLVRCLTGELSLGSWGREMLLGNVAMFLPFGVFLPYLTKEQSRAGLLRAAVAVPLAVECAQLVLGRSFDIDDLLCNFLGITLGYLVAWGLRTAGRRPAAAR